MNAIGKVRLSFEEQAVFDTYEQNRSTGAFILIAPDTLNTVAGGMITAKRGELGGIRRGEPVQGDRVILSLPADLAELLMATDAFAARRDDVEIRRVSGAEAAQILTSGDKDR
jgi:sulfate adenylyltransferase subunit 1